MMLVHKSAGGVVFGPKGLVIMVNQNHDSWSLPKGHIDEGETAEQAAIREIYEESGATAEIVKELGRYTRPRIGKGGIGDSLTESKEITFFICLTKDSVLQPIDPHNPFARWVALDDIEAMLTHELDKQFIRDKLPELKKFLASIDISTIQ